MGVEGEEGLFGPTEYYLPELLKVLSQVLKRRAIEFLNLDNVPEAYSANINQRIIDNARSRYSGDHEPRCRIAGDRLACEEGRPCLTPTPAATRHLVRGRLTPRSEENAKQIWHGGAPTRRGDDGRELPFVPVCVRRQ